MLLTITVKILDESEFETAILTTGMWKLTATEVHEMLVKYRSKGIEGIRPIFFKLAPSRPYCH